MRWQKVKNKLYITNNLLQFRWKEPLGLPECPYMYRWVLIVFGYSIRVHKWIRSDDKRHMHDHPWNFRTFVLRGHYFDVSPEGREKVTGTVYRKSTHRHYVDVPECGALTLLLCGRQHRKWGFWINGKLTMWRPLRYFSKFGHHLVTNNKTIAYIATWKKICK